MRQKMTYTDLIHETRSLADVLGRDTGVKVTFSGDGAYTNGKTINLPMIDINKELTPDVLMTVRGMLDHEAGHHSKSDLPLVLSTYDKWGKQGRHTLQAIHNNLEDVWMESKVIKSYPGSFKNLKHVEEKLKEDGLKQCKENGFDLTEINHVTVPNSIKTNTPMFNVEGSWHRKLFNELSPELQAHSNRWIEECMKAEDSGDLIKLAKAIYKLMLDDPKLESNPEDFDPESGEEFDDSENGGESIQQEIEQGLASGEASDSTDTGEITEGKPMEGREGDPLGKTIGELVASELNELDLSTDHEDNGYRPYSTEQDVIYKRGTHTTGGYRDEEINGLVNSTNTHKYEEIKKSLRSDVAVMKTRLKRALMAKNRVDWDRNREVGRLDTKALIRGHMGSPQIFKQKVESYNVDTCITVMVDLSGSMSRGRKDEAARDCCVALAECFEGTGFKYRIMGFANGEDIKGITYADEINYERVESLETIVFKDFNHTLRKTRASIGLLDRAVGMNNSDYDFLCNEVSILKNRTEKRKVLFVLSDGQPYHAASRSGYEIPLMNKLMKQAKRKHGIETVGIGIKTDAVKKIYDDHIVVNNVSDLSTKVFGKLTKILVGGVR